MATADAARARGVTEALILEALHEEASRRRPDGVLLIGVQACSTVRSANRLVGGAAVALLHLDRAAGAVGCGLGNSEHFLGDEAGLGGSGGEASGYSVVALNVEAAKSYRLLREIVNRSVLYLRADGVVLVAGPRKGGAEVAARALEEVYASVTLVAYRKGHRVYRAVGPRPYAGGNQDAVSADTDRDRIAPAGAPASAPGVETVLLRGRQLRLLLDDRIFARGRLDPATRMLAEAFEVWPGAAVLDLGCGNGVLGILAALLEPSSQATLVDSDPLAVEASRRNAALNGADNVAVHLSDVLGDLPGQTFDLILMNPPFHRGRLHDRSIAERFLAEASAALRPGGTIYVVCSRFLRYEPTLERLVGPVREAAGDRHFKVLTARSPAPRPGGLQSARHGGRHGRAGE